MFPLLWTDYRCPREDLSISCLPLLVISPFPLSIILTPSSFHHLLLFSSGIYRVAPDASTSLLCWSQPMQVFRLGSLYVSRLLPPPPSPSPPSRQPFCLSVSFQKSVCTPLTCFLSSCFLFSPTVSFPPPVSALFLLSPLLLITLPPLWTSALSVAPRNVCQHVCHILGLSHCLLFCHTFLTWRPFFCLFNEKSPRDASLSH